MTEDPIVDEIHHVRSEIAAEFGGDIHEFFDYLRRREGTTEEKVVTLQPNAPELVPPRK